MITLAVLLTGCLAPDHAVFELVSAFGGIGLTLGIPTQNYAFSGAFGPLSKLVVIVIMVRGRHRGLPVAIDRASESFPEPVPLCRDLTLVPVLLPDDLVPVKAQSQNHLATSGQQPEVLASQAAPVANGDHSEKEKNTRY